MALKAEPISAAATIHYYAKAADKLLGEIAPPSIAELALEAGLPAGVLNVVTGEGTVVGATIVAGVHPDDRLAREEVFGPVLAILPFDTEDETITNATDYGLASAVWTANLSRTHRMIRRIKAGIVHVNTYSGADLTVPLGGVKRPGNGHDKSLHIFDKCFDLKTALIKL